MAEKAVAQKKVSVALACKTFGLSETCYRYVPKLSDENEDIAGLLIAITTAHLTWGFGIEVDFSLPATRVIRSLDQIIAWRGRPLSIRVDNGPEYVSEALKQWAARNGIALCYIQPGKPQHNAYIERYNRTVRNEWLGQYNFSTISEGSRPS